MNVRLAVAAVLAALLAAGGVWVARQAPDAPAGADGGPRELFVVGPDGSVLHAGEPEAHPATPLGLLEALAASRGFTLEVERMGGFTGCHAAYVRAIAGVGETATGGWNYYLRAPGASWEWQSAGADCAQVPPGHQVEWCWVEHDVCRHHAP